MAGASRKLDNTLLANAANGAPQVVAIHPTAESIDGTPAVAGLDRPVDLALISVTGPRVEAAVADAAATVVNVGIILSAGFGENGAAGRRAQDRMAQLAAAAGCAW